MIHVQPTLDNTLGALFIGIVFATILNGVSYSQTWVYFGSARSGHSDRSDSRWLKSMVIILVFLDLVHQLSISHWLYYYCVSNFGNLAAFSNKLPGSSYGISFSTDLITIMTQGFYVWRVWKLSKSLSLTGVILVTSLAQFGFSLYFSVRAIHLSAGELTTVLGPFAIVINSLGAACDIFITSAIVFCLHKFQRSFSSGTLKRTNHLLRSVMIFSVTTGIVSR
ncbi:hypothetical protein GYMLUDRAFT_40481 [Collybiopsis luxurians FD-317 M1]|uniref:Uncharacterized protein n=1 Tax=Collybiopsis luxurians FD-317 M1 TaxID=944289 RepID=A0A0D0C7L4_9AGAR|nr:hypothetical protein GYMLUDRAFT_40481 [Collybiopsis luxurians FD-317 M1]